MTAYVICTVSAAPIRSEPAHKAEMVSQLLFGEVAKVTEVKGEWVKIISLFDNYTGWLTNHLVIGIDENVATVPCPYVSTGIMNPVTVTDGLINLPMGSSLTGYDDETRLLWDGVHKYHGTLRHQQKSVDADLLLRTIQPWMNAPYLWGGRTFMGVDCSGFVQVVFKVLGYALPRDAYQQAEVGEAVSLREATIGDVAFFVNENNRIVHVGIVLLQDKIVHASGKVRIDKLDAEGIVNSQNGQRTHKLHSIKRLMKF